MLKVISAIDAALVLSGCIVTPGMQNLDIAKIKMHMVSKRVEIHPTLIPINSSLIVGQRASTYFYRVASDDLLRISVWDHPEFNSGDSSYRVNSIGHIYFPQIGYVHVGDKTVEQIRSAISARLKHYVPNPQVDVRVADFRSQKVYVLGEVVRAGFLPINDQQLTIADALALSGGLKSKTADLRFIYVIRGNYAFPQVYWLDMKTPDRVLLAEQFSMMPRDILFISSTPMTRLRRVLGQLLPIG